MVGNCSRDVGVDIQRIVGLGDLRAAAHRFLANACDRCGLGFGLLGGALNGQTACGGNSSHHVVGTNRSFVRGELGSLQYVFRANGSNLGAGQIHSIPWIDRMAELGVAVCCVGMGHGFFVQSNCAPRPRLE